MKYTHLTIIIFSIATFLTPAIAESEFAVFSDIQGSPHSRVYNTNTGNSFLSGWDGASSSWPIYAGWRYTNWQDEEWGYAINYAHTKAISTDGSSATDAYSTLEFTDGANPITLIAMRRFSYKEFKPYVGAGLGISLPHVEVEWSGSSKTFEYQYGGPVATFLTGFSYPINKNWNYFTDYQFHYMKLNVAVDGGRLKTNLITNALNVGVSYRF